MVSSTFEMRPERPFNQEIASELRYLQYRRSRLEAAIRLLEQVIRLRKKRPPIIEREFRRIRTAA